MELEDKFSLIGQIKRNVVPYILKEVNKVLESELYDGISHQCEIVKKYIDNETQPKSIDKLVISLHLLECYHNLLKHPIHINIFKDRYGNQYLQARTTIKVKSTGKNISVNTYVGSVNEFPNGINDSKAIEKGKILLRNKLMKKHLLDF